MNTQSISGANYGKVAAGAAGAVFGALASKVLVEGINPSDAPVDPADVDGKKRKMKRNLTSVAIIGLSLAGAAMVKGGGNQESFVIGACTGMATIQTLEVLKTNVAARPDTTKANKLLNKAIGLGCGCTTPTYALNAGYTQRRVSLRNPVVYNPRVLETKGYLQNAFDKGANL